jgi:hypothetical protein
MKSGSSVLISGNSVLIVKNATNLSKNFYYYSNVAEEEIAKQFPTERRDSERWYFVQYPWQKSGPFFAYDDRKEAILVLDGYRRQHFLKFLFHNFNTATHGAH